MAALKRITCRTHGGVFKVPVKRGRPPVKCTPDNKCTNFDAHHEEDRAQARKHQPTFTSPATSAAVGTDARPKLKDTKRDLRVSVVQEAPVTTVVNTSLPLAMQAKDLLLPKGWQVAGRAWEEDGRQHAEVRATRDDEIIYMVWVDGTLITKTYDLWKNGHAPEVNGRPKNKLNFDPEEMSDVELLRILVGQKVTWWNRLGSNQETGTLGEKVHISHTYIGGRADENPGDRVVTFVDRTGMGFRSFHVSALVKVG